MNVGNLVKNTSIANGLAQEGIEVVHNLRDSDWFVGRTFGSFGGSTTFTIGVPYTYCVQWDSLQLITTCTNPLKKDANGYLGYNSGTASIFSRTLAITKISDNEFKIIVNVTWKERSGDKTVSAEEHLFNWYSL